MRGRHGFTLAEVMVAVVILASVAAASLKLVIMAQDTLAAVKDKEALLDAAREIEIGVVTGELRDDGTSGDFKWETEDKESEMFGEDFGRLDLDGLELSSLNLDGKQTQEKNAEPKKKETVDLKWRELTVSDKKGRKLVVYLQSDEDEKKDKAAMYRRQKTNEANEEKNEDED